MPPFWVGLSKQRKKPGWRRSSNCVQRVFSTFPIGSKRENTLVIEFYNFGFIAPFWVGLSKQRKKPGWRRSSNCVQKAFFQLSPSGQNEKTPLRSNFKISVSCHHFERTFPSSGKSRVHEGSPIAFKTRFFHFPHWGKTKKHPWDGVLQFRFHATIRGGLFQAAEKAGLTKGSNFTISVSCHHFGWAYPSSEKSRVDEGRPIAFNAFFQLSPSGRNEKTPLWSNFTISVS